MDRRHHISLAHFVDRCQHAPNRSGNIADVQDFFCDRGQSAAELQTRIGPGIRAARLFASADAALDHALSSLDNQDIMLATGSFVTVELLLRALPDSGELDIYGSTR